MGKMGYETSMGFIVKMGHVARVALNIENVKMARASGWGELYLERVKVCSTDQPS